MYYMCRETIKMLNKSIISGIMRGDEKGFGARIVLVFIHFSGREQLLVAETR